MVNGSGGQRSRWDGQGVWSMTSEQNGGGEGVGVKP